MATQPHFPATEVIVATVDAALAGTLTLPAHACGVVAFAHGSGSSRFSPRNRMVADTLNREGLATLLFDLLTRQESEIDEVTAELRFDVELLSQRLIGAVDWLAQREAVAALPLGLFGASTGSAAALPRVKAPTLLIVGGEDGPVIDMNRWAAARMPCEPRVEIVRGATHLFEEPGTLDTVAQLASRWFVRHLCGQP